MIKKKYITSFVIFCTLAFQVAFADVSWRDWSGDHLWNNKYNWTKTAVTADGGVVYKTMVPTVESGKVNIIAGSVKSPYGYPLINSVVPQIYRITVGGDGLGEASLTLEDGAVLSIQYIFRLGYYTTEPRDVQGRLVVNGGSLIVGDDGYIDVGSLQTDGIMIINGGSIQTPKINIPGAKNSQGAVRLNGGTLSVGLYGLNLKNDAELQMEGKIDIAGGELVVEGDVINTVKLFYQKGLITAFDGNSTLHCDYDQTYPGKTRVVAVEYDPAIARIPNPYDGKSEVGVDCILSWKASDAALSHDIYIGTDYDEVLNANRYQPDINGDGFIGFGDVLEFSNGWLNESEFSNADINSDSVVDLNDFAIIAQLYGQHASTAYKGSVAFNSYNCSHLSNGTTYYWRIDEIADGVITKGPVWSFKTKNFVDDQKPGWTLTFSDEFNGNEIDWSVWDAESGFPGHILSSRWPENVEVKDGCLRLLTRKEPRCGVEWTTGHIWSSAFKQKYGCWEASYKLADTTGLNNAFWMIHRGDFEIDIDEGHYPGEINTNLHNWAGTHWDTGQPYISGLPLSQEFHARALEWTPTEMIYYFDGQEIRRIDYSQADVDPSKEVAVRFSTAVLDWAGEITDALDGSSMDIDYVRVYVKDETPKTNTPSPADNDNVVSTQTQLSWLPGELEAQTRSYDLYFGSDYNVVASADHDSLEFILNQTDTGFTPQGLQQGTTYYWRVDEIADGETLLGDVWRFTTWQPNPNAVNPEGMTATASNTSIYGSRLPQWAVNGAGITEASHSNAHADDIMWMADTDMCWFKVDLGQSYCLDYMKLWNFNMAGYTGRGINEANVYYSNSISDPGNPVENPSNWGLVGSGGRTFTEASGREDYGMNSQYNMPDVVDMEAVNARWILIDIQSNHSNDRFTGISEIQFVAIPDSE